MIVTELVEAGRLDKHAGVRAGEAGDGEESDGCCGYEDVGVMERNRHLVEVAVGVATDEKDVEAFFRNQADAVPAFWQSEVLRNAIC